MPLKDNKGRDHQRPPRPGSAPENRPFTRLYNQFLVEQERDRQTLLHTVTTFTTAPSHGQDTISSRSQPYTMAGVSDGTSQTTAVIDADKDTDAVHNPSSSANTQAHHHGDNQTIVAAIPKSSDGNVNADKDGQDEDIAEANAAILQLKQRLHDQ